MGHVIFDAFADQTWRDIDDEWIRGEITTSERARRQFALVRTEERLFLDLIDQHAVDPSFPPLIADLREHGIPAQVVSDGFDAYVKPMLNRAGLSDLPFQSNRLVFRNGSIELEFPHERPGHDPRGGWKAGPVQALQAEGWRVAYAGDGMSDWAAAQAADLLFARSQLADRCRLDGIPYHAFYNMRDIHDWLRANLLHILAPR
jgi:2,3-diketo-5-methylthio-1-phosphopentane phosphatase